MPKTRVVAEHQITDGWMYRVKRSFKDPNKLDIYWLFDGELYGSRVQYQDETIAKAVAKQYLDYRWINKSLYLTTRKVA